MTKTEAPSTIATASPHCGMAVSPSAGDFSQTGHLDRWDADSVCFVFGYDARANVIAVAEALPAGVATLGASAAV